jgi:hypothetical protein
MAHFRKSSISRDEYYDDQHRFEHWYRDNSVYFITARCKDRFRAFASEQANDIFWDRFNFYTVQYGFIPFVTTLMDNHYHTEGFPPTRRESRCDDAAYSRIRLEIGQRPASPEAQAVLVRLREAGLF